jgi:type IV pilus assembly protein PilA
MLNRTLLQFVAEPKRLFRSRGTMKTTKITTHFRLSFRSAHCLSFRSSPCLSFRSAAEESASPNAESGFTLIELMIVMSIMLILMALAVPQMLKLKKHANETSATQTMRTIGQAEMEYDSSYHTYACPVSLLGGDPKSGAPSAQAAQLLDPTLAASSQKSGYTFTITCGSKVTINNQDVYDSYDLIGVPQSVGHSGDNGYCSNENNIVKVDPAGATNCTLDLQ